MAQNRRRPNLTLDLPPRDDDEIQVARLYERLKERLQACYDAEAELQENVSELTRQNVLLQGANVDLEAQVDALEDENRYLTQENHSMMASLAHIESLSETHDFVPRARAASRQRPAFLDGVRPISPRSAPM